LREYRDSFFGALSSSSPRRFRAGVQVLSFTSGTPPGDQTSAYHLSPRPSALFTPYYLAIEPSVLSLLAQRKDQRKGVLRSWHPSTQFPNQRYSEYQWGTAVGRKQGSPMLEIECWGRRAGGAGSQVVRALAGNAWVNGEVVFSGNSGASAAGDPAKDPPPARLACDNDGGVRLKQSGEFPSSSPRRFRAGVQVRPFTPGS
jgi:hypothetical protein